MKFRARPVASLSLSARHAASPALLLMLALATAACGGHDGPKGQAESTAVPKGPLPTVTMTLTVPPATAEGRRDAAVSITTTGLLLGAQLDFELPATCQYLAGAATRVVPSIGVGQPTSQGLGFQCPPGTSGRLVVKLAAKDASGRAVESSAEAGL